MKVRTNRIYPYPVLSETTDNFIDNKFDSDIVLEYDSETAYITISIELHDKAILSLIKSGKVGLICHIECSVTKFRQSYDIPTDKMDGYQIEIPLMYLNESIEAMCMLMAKEEILFIDDNLNELYKDELITYPKYSTIGYTDTDEYLINKVMNTNGDIPPIIQIVQSQDDKEVTYDCTNTFIYVYVPKAIHEYYYDLTGDFIRTKQVETNITVLTEIINNIKHGADYSGCGWYQVLEDKLKFLGYENGFDEVREKDIESIVVAQQSLGYPFEDSFKELVESKERGA